MISISSFAPRNGFAWPNGRPVSRPPIWDVVLLALAHHHVGRVVEHALDQHPARGRHDHRRVRVLAHRHGQAPDVVEVAVGDDDQVEGLAPERREVGGGRAAHLLRVQAAVDQHVELADLDEQRIGADAAVAVQVD
jgi:hypothetical protein